MIDELEFLCCDQARSDDEFEPALASPLARALAEADGLGVSDTSLTARIEVRGDLDALDGLDLPGRTVPITGTRALVLCAYEEGAGAREKLRRRFDHVLDMTGAYAGLELTRPDARTVLRRICDLDLDRLPAVGAVAGVRGLVLSAGDGFELVVPQEYGHHVAEVVVDAIRGLS